MTTITEDMLVAYADGEIDEINRRRVERALAQDSALAARLAAHQALREKLAAHYAPVADEAVPDRFARLLQESHVIDLAEARVTKAPRPLWRGWAAITAVAASLVLGLLVGRQLPVDSGPIAVRGNAMVAQGTLAKALDTQLASAQAADAPVRIGLTFRAKAGGWCRSFDGAALSGVACRRADGWHVEQALPGSAATTAYRQASSGDTRIIGTIAALMADAPADADAEKAAQASGWR